jgi:hypothetical protein
MARRVHQQQMLLQYLTSVIKIEQDTGVSFFPELPAELRMRVENDVEKRMW